MNHVSAWDVHYEKKYGFEMGREMHAKVITVKPLNSGNLQVFFCPLLKGVRYWEVVQQRFPQLGLNILPAIQGMSTIWDVGYWEFSLYLCVSGALEIAQTRIFCSA